MPKIHAIQNSFAAGQLSPLMGMRTDTDGYRSGCAVLENYYSDSRGPALSRHGTTYITRYPNKNDARVFTLQVSATFFYIIVLIDLEMRILTVTGSVLSNNEITNPRFADGGVGWTDTSTGASTVTFSPNFTVLTPEVHPIQNEFSGFGQSVSLGVAGGHTLSVTNYGTQIIELRVGSAAGLADIASVKSSDIKIDLFFSTALPTVWVEVRAYDDDMVIAPVTGRSAIIVFLELSADGDVELSYTTPWLEADLPNIHTIADPTGKSAYFVHPNYSPYKIEYDSLSDSFQFAIVNFKNPPVVWFGSNWPRTGTFHQGRLWLGGTPNQAETFWGSTSTDPEDFNAGTGLDDEAIEYTLANYGAIQWMKTTKNLLVGTSSGENIVVSQSGVLTPTDVDVLTQSAYGSDAVQATQIGDQVIYISGGQKVRAMQYAWSEDNWLSKDLTYVSEDITASGITGTAWVQNPHNLFWCVLGNGDAATMTYERSNNVYGWHKHTTQGAFLDMEQGEFAGQFSINAIATVRVPGSVDIEFMGLRNWTVDSRKSVSYIVPQDFADGFEHLEGFTVQVTTDGAVHPDRVVGAESEPGAGDGVFGRIYLQSDASNIVAGLGYTSKLQTLPYNQGGGPQDMGSYKKRYNKIFVSVFNSSVPLINGVRPPDRYDATPMGEGEPLRTVTYEVSNLGWSDDATITVEQDLQEESAILGIYGQINIESLD